jgi:heme exporter protein CcmD
MGTNRSDGEKIMNEFLNMGGYAFYVWSSIGFFIIAMIIDFVSLNFKERSIKRTIKSFIKRKNR